MKKEPMSAPVRPRLPTDGFITAGDLVRNPRRPGVVPIIPCSRVTLWRWVRLGIFPPPIYLGEGGRITAWAVEDVRRWMAAKAGRPVPTDLKVSAAEEAAT